MTVEEQTSFVQIMNDQERGCRYWEQMMLMLCTGMRMGEINALDVHDVNLTFRTVNVRRTVTKDQTDHAVIGTKTKTYAGQRLLSLTDAPFRILSEYIEQWQPNRLDLLFYDFKGHKILTTSQVNLQFQRILKNTMCWIRTLLAWCLSTVCGIHTPPAALRAVCLLRCSRSALATPISKPH